VASEFVKVIDNIDISKSYFEYYEDGEVKQLILHILPKQNEKNIEQSRKCSE